MKKINRLASENVIHAPGRVIKHPTMIRYHSERNGNGLLRENMNFIAVDFETDYQTGETKLIGCFDGDRYWSYDNAFLENLAMLIRYAVKNGRALVYWSRFDPLQIFRVLLMSLPPEKRHDAIAAYEKIGGSWDKKSKSWLIPPVLETIVGNKRVGVSMVIRGNLQLFCIDEDSEYCDTTWTYNIAPFYAESIADTAKRYNLTWYTKIADEVHLIDAAGWERFKVDTSFRGNVMLSNKYDAMAAWHLARKLGEDFAAAFWGWYPKSHISVGSHGRAFISAYAEHAHEDLFGEERKKAVSDDLRTLSIQPHLESWRKQLGDDTFKDFYSACHEVYKGAKIECYGYGFYQTAVIADLTQAYPDTEKDLLDLRDSVVDVGFGIPPLETSASYVFIRGTINIPPGTEYHPFLIRKPGDDTTNICPTGSFIKTTYWRDERDVGEKMGITFEDEIWYRITTKGQKSIFAGAILAAVKMREALREAHDPNEFRPKQMAAAGYGIRFEATPLYTLTSAHKEEIVDRAADLNPYREILKQYRGSINLDGIVADLKANYGDRYASIRKTWHGGKRGPDVVARELSERGITIEAENPADIMIELLSLYNQKSVQVKMESVEDRDIVFDGLRAGDFFEPVSASRITMKTRVKISEACLAVVSAGGRPIFAQTDSIAWEGTESMLPETMWRVKKTLGYFEKPATIHDLVSLGAGRYEYSKVDNESGEWTKLVAKSRGVYMEKLLDEEGVELDDINWRNALRHLVHHLDNIPGNDAKKPLRRGLDGGLIVLRMKVLVTPGLVSHSNTYASEDIGRIVLITKILDPVTGRKKRRIEIPKDLSMLADAHIWSSPPNVTGGMVSGEDEIDDTLPDLRNEMMGTPFPVEKKRHGPHERDAMEKFDRRTKYNLLRHHGFDPAEAGTLSFRSYPNVMLAIKAKGI
jgi:hypothetical protein